MAGRSRRSPYYLIVGAALIASGILIALGRRLGVAIYALILLGTVLWSLVEVGTDGWALLPRLIAPAVLGLWIAMPWVSGRLGGLGPDRKWALARWSAAAVCAALILFVFAAGWAISTSR
jgi:quinoprotein glucose dehydrogenase